MDRKSKPGVWTSERCYIAEIINNAAWPEFSMARARVEPGTTTQQHALSVHEFYVIEEGAGVMYLDDTPPFEVHPGDVVSIPKDAPQHIKNTGKTDLIFTCICAPKFSQDCYTSLE